MFETVAVEWPGANASVPPDQSDNYSPVIIGFSEIRVESHMSMFWSDVELDN